MALLGNCMSYFAFRMDGQLQKQKTLQPDLENMNLLSHIKQHKSQLLVGMKHSM